MSGNVNGKHLATTQTQICHNIAETAHNTRPRKRCRKRTDTANVGTFPSQRRRTTKTVLSPFEIRTLNHLAAPRASHTRPDKKCLNICVPGSGTTKIRCTFGEQTVTCEETHARNADKTQKDWNIPTERSESPEVSTSSGCSTHVIGSDAPLTNNIHTKRRTYSNNTLHHEDLVAVRGHCSRHTALSAKWCNNVAMHVAPSDGQLRQQFGRF